MRHLGTLAALIGLFGCGLSARAQVIEYESNGLHYQALTKGGVTVLFAELPSRVREYAMLEVAITNGSQVAWVARPEDFTFHRSDGSLLRTTPARSVVLEMLDRGGRNDVIKLVNTYEMALYGMQHFKATNGYEARRQAAQAEVSSTKLKAAATASAIAFVSTKLEPGQSTDGAIFFMTGGKHLGGGRLVVNLAGEVFEFDSYVHTP